MASQPPGGRPKIDFDAIDRMYNEKVKGKYGHGIQRATPKTPNVPVHPYLEAPPRRYPRDHPMEPRTKTANALELKGVKPPKAPRVPAAVQRLLRAAGKYPGTVTLLGEAAMVVSTAGAIAGSDRRRLDWHNPLSAEARERRRLMTRGTKVQVPNDWHWIEGERVWVDPLAGKIYHVALDGKITVVGEVVGENGVVRGKDLEKAKAREAEWTKAQGMERRLTAGMERRASAEGGGGGGGGK